MIGTAFLSGYEVRLYMAINEGNWLQIALRPNKKISVFWVTGLKILGRVGTYLFFCWKKYNFMHFERHNFQNA